MAQWTSFDFPPLPPHNPTRAPTHPTRPLTHPTRAPTHPTRPLTHPTRPPTQPTRPLTHPEPSILGNPPAHFGGSYRGGGVDGGRRGGPRGGGGGGRGGGRSHRGGRMGGRKVNDGYEGNFAGGKVSYDGNLCEKFDELEVIEESFELAKSLNYNGTDNSDGMINGRINGNVGVNVNGNVGVNVNGNDDDEKINGGNNDSFKVKYEDASDEIPVEASGQNVPKPVSNFGEITELGFALHENIKRCKYVKPTPIQRHAIPILMAGRDLMACAQTGSGKTAAFCFPIIAGILKRGPAYRPPGGGVGGGSGGGGGGFRGRGRVACPVALIMSPTRELSSQIHDEAKKFAHQTNVKVVVAYGGTPMSEQLYKLERGVDILVATPGRLVDMIERGRVSLRMVRYFALDEADRMLDMGFEPQIRKIAQQMDMPRTGARQTMLFSATFPTEIQRLASDFLSNYIFLTVGKVGSSNEMIEQKVELVDEYDKRKHLKDLLLAQEKLGLTIVFAETKRAVDSLAEWLSRNGFPATAIHGDKVQMERERALRSFKSGATPIIVATDVAARGLDIPCVAHVINYDLPRDIEHYVHRIGRTGRAGKSGLATAFFCDKDRPISKALAELMEEANQAVPSWLSEYARSSSNGYGGDSGGGRRNNRAGKFGGHDYRSFDHADLSNTYTDNNSSTHTEDYTRSYATEDYTRSYANEAPKAAYNEHYSSSYSNEVPKAAYTEDYTSTYEVPKAESFGGCGADSYASPAFGATRAYETIVATGWD